MEQMDLFRAIVKGRYEEPKHISEEAKSIIKGFLTRDPAQRLGSLAGGEDDIAAHPWFKNINFEDLELKSVTPPKVPNVKDPLDASNFEDWSHLDDKTKMKFPRLTTAQKQVFEVWNLISDKRLTIILPLSLTSSVAYNFLLSRDSKRLFSEVQVRYYMLKVESCVLGCHAPYVFSVSFVTGALAGSLLRLKSNGTN